MLRLFFWSWSFFTQNTNTSQVFIILLYLCCRQISWHCINNTCATRHPSIHLRPQRQQEVVQWCWHAWFCQEWRLHRHLLTAHQEHRYWCNLVQNHFNVNLVPLMFVLASVSLQVIIGGGRKYMTPRGTKDPEYPRDYSSRGKRKDGRHLINEWKNMKLGKVACTVTDAVELPQWSA